MTDSDSAQSMQRVPVFLMLLALACFALGLVLSPGLLLSLGIMEDSLTCQVERIRDLGMLEVRIAKILLLVLSVFWLGIGLYWRRILTSAPIRKIREHPCRFYLPQQANAIINRSFIALLAGVVLAWIHIVFGKLYWNATLFRLLNTEDGVVENASALLFLACCVVSLATIPLVKSFRERKVIMILFAIGFFLCFGEEISWGQRIFNFQTPDMMKEVNVQAEVNLHNMFGVLSDHLFLFAMVTYGVLFPLLQRISPFWRSFLSALGLPIPSLGLALGFVMAALLQTNIIWKYYPPSRGIWIKEIRELLMALGLLLLMFEYRRTLAGVRDSKQE